MRLVLVLAATLLTGCATGPQDPMAFYRGAANVPPAARPHTYEAAPAPAPTTCTGFTDDGVVYSICH